MTDVNPESMDIEQLANEVNDGRLIKMEVDYKPVVDEALPAAQALAKSGNVVGALDKLYPLEKQTRLGHDMRSNCRLLETMVQLCFDAGNYDLLCETAQTLAKKRSLIKAAVTRMVKLCCTFVEKTSDMEKRLQLIEALRTITAGKIYVEVERARMTKLLVQHKESLGDTEAAANLLLELQVETFGSMELKEKVEYLLEQMRLTIIRRDFVRTSIIGKKISTRFFEKDDEEIQKMKLRYYRSMIKLDVYNEKYLEVARHYRHITVTPIVQADKREFEDAVKCAVLYTLLTEHSNEQWDMLQRLHTSDDLINIPLYKELIECFTEEMIISWPGKIEKQYERHLRKGSDQIPATDVFAPGDAEAEARWQLFQTRVGEHNIRMLAKYYSQMTLTNMAKLLDWPVDKTEQFVCTMVTSGVIPEARINRLNGIVTFRRPERAITVLDGWAHDLRDLTDSLNKVTHLIDKEVMVHKYLHGTMLTAMEE